MGGDPQSLSGGDATAGGTTARSQGRPCLQGSEGFHLLMASAYCTGGYVHVPGADLHHPL